MRDEVSRRKRLKEAREKRQLKLIPDREIFAEKIQSKLVGLLDTKQFENFCRCGKEEFYRTCKSCGDVQTTTYTCNVKWCPRCNFRIVNRRAELLKKWQVRIHNPMHLVTTQRNFELLTRRKIREHTRHLAKLRRQKVFSRVQGGCVSVEITNEGRGWHLHAHWLIDADFVDIKELAIVWGRLVGQDFGIVHFNKIRPGSFCHEVCKYVVKGSEMSDWHPELLNQFVRSIHGSRFFFLFGSLHKQAASMRAELNQEKKERAPCECGSLDFVYRTEVDEILHDLRNRTRAKSR